MGLPIPGGRQVRPNRRFLPESKAGCECSQELLRRAMNNTRKPAKITLDSYAASHRAVREMKEDGELPRRMKVRSSQYLNNLIEQDHRRVKQRIRPIVVLAKSDLIDKLEVVLFPSIPLRTPLVRSFDHTFRLLSEPCGAPVLSRNSISLKDQDPDGPASRCIMALAG